MRKICLFTLVCLAWVLVLAGCAGLIYKINDPALLNDHLTKAYNQPAEACYEAAVTYFNDKGVYVTTDPVAATIDTKRFPVWQGAYASGNAFGVSAQRIVVEMKVSFEISGNESQCIVRATKLKFWQNDEEMTNIGTNDGGYGKYWKPIFSGIKSNLDDLTKKYKSEDVREIDVNSVTRITMPLKLQESADTPDTATQPQETAPSSDAPTI